MLAPGPLVLPPGTPCVQTLPTPFRGRSRWPLLLTSTPSLPYPHPLSHAEDPAWKAVYGEIEFDCNHHSVFENAVDMVSARVLLLLLAPPLLLLLHCRPCGCSVAAAVVC